LLNIVTPPASKPSIAQTKRPQRRGYAGADLRVGRVFTQPTRWLNSKRVQLFPAKTAIVRKVTRPGLSSVRCSANSSAHSRHAPRTRFRFLAFSIG
jgi:hypothetical protein